MAGKGMTAGLIKAHEQPDRSDWKIRGRATATGSVVVAGVVRSPETKYGRSVGGGGAAFGKSSENEG